MHQKYATNCMSGTSIGLMVILVFAHLFASWRSRLQSWRSLIHALLILDWRKLSLALMSGRAFVAAYCSDPTSPRMLCLSDSVMGVFSFFLLSRFNVDDTDFISHSFLDLDEMVPLLSWWMWIPVKVKSAFRLEPNGNLASSLAMTASKRLLPAQSPSSTWTPSIPSIPDESFDGKVKRHGSRGLITKPKASSVSFNSQYQRKGALINPYADLRSSHISLWRSRR